MNEIHNRLAALGVKIPEIIFPASGTDLLQWAVIACDQFTQDNEYWEKVKAEAGSSPSTLNFIYPEIYLTADKKIFSEKINNIHTAMRSFLDSGNFSSHQCAVYIERSTPHNKKRRGLVLAVDLDKYDWNPKARSLIRATEGTVPERLPPRMDIRRNAPLETTHILLLIDDEHDAIIPGIGAEAMKHKPIYETQLMMNSGAVTGWALDLNSEKTFEKLASGLESLAQKAGERYGVNDETPFLFAAGDGNHSLASAKAIWDEYKAAHIGETGLDSHPLRYALVELENIHDQGIGFEPIHRIVLGAEPDKLRKALSALKDIECVPMPSQKNVLRIKSNSSEIATAVIEPFLDSLKAANNYTIDYIHGQDDVMRHAANYTGPTPEKQAVGLMLPPVRKDGFFRTIAQKGPLPRKSFSMGEGCEKRFYFECRKLI